TKSLAASAASGRPNTGAATKPCPASACAVVNRSHSATLIVDDDTWIPPEFSDCSTPPSPNVTASTASSLASIVNTTSAAAASATDRAGAAPRAANASTLSCDRL